LFLINKYFRYILKKFLCFFYFINKIYKVFYFVYFIFKAYKAPCFIYFVVKIYKVYPFVRFFLIFVISLLLSVYLVFEAVIILAPLSLFVVSTNYFSLLYLRLNHLIPRKKKFNRKYSFKSPCDTPV
jgi:hypothetical protein